MRQSDSKIVFGPGGRIRDDGRENEELLEQIKRTPALPPSDLLKLAEFYEAYPTNAPLANHLTLIALATLLDTREIHENLQENFRQATLAAGKPTTHLPNVVASLDDFFEDLVDQGYDEGPNDQQRPWATVEVKWIPVSGIGLLVETPGRKGKQHKKHYYVIGVSPDPDSL